MLAAKLLCGVGEEKLYVDDVFSAYTYTGNGSTQTITNGVDLAGKGGLVWVKDRSQSAQHSLFDTARGVGNVLSSNTTNAQAAGYPYTVQSTGFTANHGQINTNAVTYASWTFRKAPKFFDVVTYTGNGTAQTIAHSLGVQAGMVIIKRTDTTSNWAVWHTKLGTGPTYGDDNVLFLNTTAAKTVSAAHFGGTINSNTFYISSHADINASGGTYVAYVFAHDTSTDGLIQCGSFTTDASGNATVNLGWEPQYLMEKASSATGGWFIHDTSRGFNVSGTAYLYANTVGAESVSTTNYYKPTATGFVVTAEIPSTTYVYMAIRRPNKPPTLGTQVYNAIARTGTGAAATVTGVGFAPDLVMPFNRSGVAGMGHPVYDRLRGALKSLRANLTNVENTDTASLTGFGVDGITVGADGSEFINSSRESSIINHFFKRAPGVFDVVCYTGSGANKTEAHNLGVAPELWIIKDRDATNDWGVGCAYIANTEYLALNGAEGKTTGATYWNSTFPTASVFSLGSMARVNTSTYKYVAYLFATKAGISKVGSYTGTATTKQIDCGFTTGARFVLIKRTDSTGDWYVWDTVRGIIAGNDPYLLLNSTAAEVTSTDYIDPYTSGFELSSTAPAAINASGGSFIYLAFA